MCPRAPKRADISGWGGLAWCGRNLAGSVRLPQNCERRPFPSARTASSERSERHPSEAERSVGCPQDEWVAEQSRSTNG